MKNKKIILISALAILGFGILIFVAVKSPSINLLGMAPPEKVIEFKDTKLIGRSNGQKTWEITAEEIWSTKNQGMTTFENVKDGTIYKNGRAVVKNLRASKVRYHRWSGDVEAFDGASALVDLENIASGESSSGKTRFVTLIADEMKYNKDSEIAQAKGNVRIFEKDFEIRGSKMEIKGKSNKALISGGVRIAKEKTKITGNNMDADLSGQTYIISGNAALSQEDKLVSGETAFLDEEKGTVRLENNVRFFIKEENAILSCDAIDLSTENENGEASGSVLITQKEKRAKSDRAVYTSDSETVVMTGNVYIEREGEWIKTEKVIVSLKDESFEAVGRVEAEFKIKK